MAELSYPYLEMKQNTKRILLTKIPAGVLTNISYAAVRGKNDEAGAVQRILNSRRIDSNEDSPQQATGYQKEDNPEPARSKLRGIAPKEIKRFTIEVGDFPGSIILNWVSSENPLRRKNDEIVFEKISDSAQIIDGQHRLAGIRVAIEEEPRIKNLELSVAIYENLSTRECADIFLSINTEQKTVPRSLVFDLYGLASEPVIDAAAERVRDIAVSLNEEDNSPYQDLIKLPGAPRRKGGIALSTAVTALKPLVGQLGSFEQIGVKELELQKRIILNFFSALEEKYGDRWENQTNAFMYASGFVGALDFFRQRVIPYCNNIRSFKKEDISQAIELKSPSLIFQFEVKGLGGKDAPKRIYERLSEVFLPEISSAEGLQV